MQTYDNTPIVSVICATYNQEKYIAQCLEGILMQKTDFPYELIVNDDASTDGTASIIRKFEAEHDNVVAIYQVKNLWSQGYSIPRTVLYPRTRGKYIAICEGDDYWTDPYKLQKQVDYMEAHPDVSVCATEGYILNQASGEMRPVYDSKNLEFTALHFLKDNPIYTLSTLSRASWVKEYQLELAPLLPKFLMGDYPMWLYLVKRGRVVLLKDKCFVYRELDQSASHFKSTCRQIDFYLSAYDIKIYFNRLMNYGKRFMIYRKFRDLRKEIKRLSKERGESFWKLYLYGLKCALFNSNACPSPQARRAVKNILK